MTVKAKNLTLASIVLGSLGFVLFIYCKLGYSKAQGQKCPLNLASKVLIAIGIFLLAGAVYELSDKNEPFCASYCSTAHDPDSNPWSYKTFCGPPPS
jgi:hypothetical protein